MSLPGSTNISFLQDNPKRAGCKAHARYEEYKSAHTVDEALRKGASRADIANDHKQGYLKVLSGADSEAPEAKARAVQPPTAAAKAKAVQSPSAPAKAAQPQSAPAQAVQPPSAAAQAVQPPRAPAQAVQPLAPAAGVQKRPMEEIARPSEAAPCEETSAKRPRSAPPLPPPAENPPPEVQVAASPCQGSDPPASSSSAPSLRFGQGVDLSFAKLEGKPLKFIRRVMGEAQRLLCPKGLEDSKKEGYEFELLDRDNLSKWVVRVRDLNKDSQLAKDLQKLNLDACIHLEMSLPDGFPMEPPFVRVLYPFLVGGFVFGHGGICFEPLTPKGWSPAMTLPSLAIAIKGILDYGDVQCKSAGNRETKTVPQYSEKGARSDYQVIVNAHRGGDSFGSLKGYKS